MIIYRLLAGKILQIVGEKVLQGLNILCIYKVSLLSWNILD